MYDIFVISKETVDKSAWNNIKQNFPNAQLIEYCTDLKQVSRKSFTKMFWIIWDDVIYNNDFNLYEYRATKYDDMYVHVFKNGACNDGICLVPKNNDITHREFEHRFFTNKKEIDIKASNPKKYDVFEISTYEEYCQAAKISSSSMFYVVWPDLIKDVKFNFDYQVPYHNQHITHVFKNGNFYDGICLFSKTNLVTKKEFDNRFFINKKEVDILASFPKKFEKFYLKSYDDYLKCVNETTTNMFYVVWPDVDVADDFDFNYQVPYYNQHITHVFKNKDYYDGISLFSKKYVVAKKEFDNRFFIEKKEIDIVASFPKSFDIFYLESFLQYEQALQQSTTNMFWVVWSDVEVSLDFRFDYQVPYYNQHITHVFLNGEHRDGICIFSKNSPISVREFDKRYFVNKKEIDIVASIPKHVSYDIVFISYNEPNADDNYKILKNRFSRVKRVHGVKGIHNAHIHAATIAETEMFYVVDGDAIIVDDFLFDYVVPKYERNHVHVWRSRNPLNNLEYGYGGVKLLPKEKTLNMNTESADMTTSISNNFKVMNQVSNVTVFNTDPFNTWKSAFRECVKLSSQVIARQESAETVERLDTWCTIADGKFGYYAIQGAMEGRKYGEENKGSIDALKRINDFDWLKQKFNETQ